MEKVTLAISLSMLLIPFAGLFLITTYILIGIRIILALYDSYKANKSYTNKIFHLCQNLIKALVDIKISTYSPRLQMVHSSIKLANKATRNSEIHFEELKINFSKKEVLDLIFIGTTLLLSHLTMGFYIIKLIQSVKIMSPFIDFYNSEKPFKTKMLNFGENFSQSLIDIILIPEVPLVKFGLILLNKITDNSSFIDKQINNFLSTFSISSKIDSNQKDLPMKSADSKQEECTNQPSHLLTQIYQRFLKVSNSKFGF